MATRHTRKPRLALMGEFSAGKSTLTNFLLGDDPLPTRVTATRLPPVWITAGTGPAERMDRNGDLHEVPAGVLDTVNPETTRMIRLHQRSDVLDLCDLIDMPGISDPNMPADTWTSMLDEIDQVVWCTHATQAWRQSEAAMWDAMRERTNGRNLLLVTQVDKLASRRDRNRVMARLERETRGLFEGRYPISLTEAQAAGDDEALWKASGAAKFTEHLVDLLLDAAREGTSRPVAAPVAQTQPAPVPDQPAVAPKRVRNRPGGRLRTRPLVPSADGSPSAVGLSSGAVTGLARAGERS